MNLYRVCFDLVKGDEPLRIVTVHVMANTADDAVDRAWLVIRAHVGTEGGHVDWSSTSHCRQGFDVRVEVN